MKWLLSCLLLTLCWSTGRAQSFVVTKIEGKVVKVVDGDTFELLSGTDLIRVRLNAIDAPEKKQPFATKSKEALAVLCAGKQVMVIARGHDRYKRTIGDLYLGSTYINGRMIELGMAWHFKKYSSDKTLAEFETAARKQRQGLWAEAHPVAPWDYREARRKKKADH